MPKPRTHSTLPSFWGCPWETYLWRWGAYKRWRWRAYSGTGAISSLALGGIFAGLCGIHTLALGGISAGLGGISLALGALTLELDGISLGWGHTAGAGAGAHSRWTEAYSRR